MIHQRLLLPVNERVKDRGRFKTQVYLLPAAHIVERAGGERDLRRHRESRRGGDLQRQVLHGERASGAPGTGSQLLQHG